MVHADYILSHHSYTVSLTPYFLLAVDMYQNMDCEGSVVMIESPFTQLYDSVIYTGASLIQRTSNLTIETTNTIVGSTSKFIESTNQVSRSS